MSSSSQHGASRKRKRDAAQDSESQGIDDARKRIHRLTRILEEPDSSRISDEAILFNATSAIEFMDDFEKLVTATDISISNPRDILEEIGMDGFGRLFIKRWKQSDHTYHSIFRNISFVIGNRRDALKAVKELLGQVHKLPGISPCISIVWDLASFAHTAAEKEMQNVDYREFLKLCDKAEEKLGQKISEVERMIQFYSKLDIRDAWTVDTLKSTSIFELLQLRPDDVKALNDLSSVQETAAFLKKKLEPFKKLHGLIEALQMEL
ncbi:hypothetical protein NEUTE1DRAFT_107346 [Neurospora tetrasperma FGSC 2508]|uniref:Uncharacterized protein n=1 Tax=Neurospora tetrasperma (strain FGSC 2508 / ATCC MYA-4615 / P0657) TaxID=510951 RepID=F8ME71_NEUT8|nr:uncharacterized protein NEUTE1DRAFT_107346 [Neurospora tetrasperma FGSC 2508]EGO60755.1 hypothetical protein NEUTE1DRAFT_107346 [Neurospora tetrasperma FGSC 2508]EGZ75255.1 hypothetical protein NEUTE2DRAFT_164155 [Neurospora tetrasperma FGSC 2509]